MRAILSPPDDVTVTLSEGRWARAKRDAEAFRHSIWFLGLEAITAAVFGFGALLASDSGLLARLLLTAACALLGLLVALAAIFVVHVIRAPSHQRDEARSALQQLVDEQTALRRPSDLAESVRQLRVGLVAPHNRRELAIALEGWCGELTSLLRRFDCVRPGELGHPPAPDSVHAALAAYHEELQARGTQIIDYGMALRLTNRALRARLYKPQSTDELWVLNDDLWRQHVGAWENEG